MSLNVYKSPGIIETEVLMMRQENARKSFLVLEGVDDIRFWTSRVADQECELIDGNGKPNVEGALVRLDGRRFAGALGVVDDDCDVLECRSLPSPNLIATDAHDLECVLLRSSALDRALAEFGSKTKIKKFVEMQGREIRDVLLEIGIELGLLRRLSRRDGWPYPFETNGPARFVDETTWTLDTNRLHDAVVEAGPYGCTGELRSEISALPAGDPWFICQGHDLIAILRIGLRKVLGNLKASIGVDVIAGFLRGAHQVAELEESRLGMSIRGWEELNAPYRIL